MKQKMIILTKLQQVDIFLLLLMTIISYLAVHKSKTDLVLGLIIWASILLIVIVYYVWRFKISRHYIPDENAKALFIERHSPLGRYCVSMTQSKKPITKCYDVISVFSDISKLDFPKGKFKAITHPKIISDLSTIGTVNILSDVLYTEKLSEVRHTLLGKNCPCSNMDCPLYSHLVTKADEPVDFKLIHFEIN